MSWKAARVKSGKTVRQPGGTIGVTNFENERRGHISRITGGHKKLKKLRIDFPFRASRGNCPIKTLTLAQ